MWRMHTGRQAYIHTYNSLLMRWRAILSHCDEKHSPPFGGVGGGNAVHTHVPLEVLIILSANPFGGVGGGRENVVHTEVPE